MEYPVRLDARQLGRDFLFLEWRLGMRYRKKPVVIEAFQYDGDLKGSDGNYYVPDWVVKAFENGVMFYSELDAEPSELFINTLEGTHHVSVGDYVI